MKRRLAIILSALVISVSCYVGLSSVGTSKPPAPVVTVKASYCTYSTVEHTNYGYVSFYSPWIGKTDYLNVQVITRDGDYFSGVGCGAYKQYEVAQWTSYGTPGSYYSEVRAWICGSYWGAWARFATTEYSTDLNYGSCGRQADNYGSYFYDTYTGLYHSVYVTQG